MDHSAQELNQHNYALGKPMLGLRHLYDLVLDLRYSTSEKVAINHSIQRIND